MIPHLVKPRYVKIVIIQIVRYLSDSESDFEVSLMNNPHLVNVYAYYYGGPFLNSHYLF